MPDRVTLELLSWRLAVCKLPSDASLNLPGRLGEFWAYTVTPQERSLVCNEDLVEQSLPPGTQAETGWRALRVAGSLDFALVGILASIANPLAQAGVSIFALSTYDTDYVLVKESEVARAVGALTAAGFPVVRRS
jgi:hypothetical protein